MDRLDELPSLCLGFGGHTTRGRSVDRDTQGRILQTAKEIVDLGVKDPELFSLIGLLESGVGPDTIGDMTAHAILPSLIEITADAAKQLKVKVKEAHIDGYEVRLPHNKFSEKPLLLVPLDILRDLAPKLKAILKAKNDQAARSERTPTIVVIDAKKKASASKR